MSEWQTIETAPRNGSPFLGYLGAITVPFFVCWFAPSIKDGLTPYICILGIGELYDPLLIPTHWMPLPEPPK